MTESATEETPPSTTDADEESTDEESTDEQSGSAESQRETLLRYAQWVAFGILALIALIATLQFYFSAQETIRTFVSRRYRPLFSMGFNLVILLASGIGITLLVRRLA